jgi:hypothetical protein
MGEVYDLCFGCEWLANWAEPSRPTNNQRMVLGEGTTVQYIVFSFLQYYGAGAGLAEAVMHCGSGSGSIYHVSSCELDIQPEKISN